MTTATLSEFAAMQGVKPSYITKLKQAGRLVLTTEGRVDVEASRQRIEETRDPNRDDVARRHAQDRTEPRAPQPPPALDIAGEGFQKARAVKERYLALTAKLEYEKAAGAMVPSAEVRAAGAEAGAALRAAMENLPDQLAPALVGINDEARIHAMLAEHVEIVLKEISGKLAGDQTTGPAA